MRVASLNKFHFVFAVVILAMLSSCGDNPHFDHFYSFDKNEWSQDVKPSFDVKIEDTSKWYDLVITLRTTTDYSYSNFWMFLNTETPSGLTAREPYQIPIANDKGAWIGRKSGTVVENELVFRKRKFPKAGTYKFVLEQGITEQTVDEVLNVGLSMFEYEDPQEN